MLAVPCHPTVGIVVSFRSKPRDRHIQFRIARVPADEKADARPMPHPDYLSFAPFAFKRGAKLVTNPWFLAGTRPRRGMGISCQAFGWVRARAPVACLSFSCCFFLLPLPRRLMRPVPMKVSRAV